jgi:hypothetical protein
MSKFDELYESVMEEGIPKRVGIRDAEKLLMRAGRTEMVGQAKGGRTVGITRPYDNYHSQKVYKVNGKYVVAYKSVGTAPWSYNAYDSEADLKDMTPSHMGQGHKAIAKSSEGKNFDKIIAAIK